MRDKLSSLIRATTPVICVVSAEEVRAQAEVEAVAQELGYTLLSWNEAAGLARISRTEKGERVVENLNQAQAPDELLAAVLSQPEKTIVVAADFHLAMEPTSPPMVRGIKNIVTYGLDKRVHFIIVGCRPVIPPELEHEVVLLEFGLPDRQTLGMVVDNFSESAGVVNPPDERDRLIDAASGLTVREAEQALAVAFIENGRHGIPTKIVAREKALGVKRGGLLEILETGLSMADVGGNAELKQWMRQRKRAFTREAIEYGLPTPKGVLCVGCPGTGKSLSAKAAAAELGLPLLKLDAGRMFGSLVGESERNMRNALAVADATAPCVLFIDELEKGFGGSRSSNATDGGTATRVVGTLLNWMQDKSKPVFVFATANDVSQLPPELLRRGRFDEMFFVDLPSVEDREDIFRIHLAKVKRDHAKFDVGRLARLTDGWTGAEIESAIGDALYAAFDVGVEIADKHIVEAAAKTVPLSRTMEAEIKAMRQWAHGRARNASGTQKIVVAQQIGQRNVSQIDTN